MITPLLVVVSGILPKADQAKNPTEVVMAMAIQDAIGVVITVTVCLYRNGSDLSSLSDSVAFGIFGFAGFSLFSSVINYVIALSNLVQNYETVLSVANINFVRKPTRVDFPQYIRGIMAVII